MTRKAAAMKEAQPDLLGGNDVAAKKAEPAKTKTAAKVKAAEPIAKPAVNKGNLTVVKSTPTNTLALIADALKDPTFKPESMKLVLDMHRDMVGEQARLDYIAAMRELKRKLPTINKDGKIEYKDKGDGKGKPKPLHFASFEHIHDVIRPLLDEHGFDLWFSSEPGAAGMINVIGNLEHENGYVRRTVLPMPHDASGGKSGAQGWASAFSFGKRIVTIGLLNIQTRAPEDRDLDGNKAKVTKAGKPQVVEGHVLVDQPKNDEQVDVCSEDQLVKVREAIEGCGVPEKTFLNHFQIKKVSQLPAADYADALLACKAYAEKHK